MAACLGSRRERDDGLYRVVVVGASFAGLQAALEVSSRCHVTVVDNKDFFEFTPSMHTAVGGTRSLAPLHAPLDDSLVRDCTFVRGVATGARLCDGGGGGGVLVVAAAAATGGGQGGGSAAEEVVVPFDALVVACGCSYPGPIKFASDGVLGSGERLAEVERFRGTLAKAKDILVVGGGAVGVEVAAEVLGEGVRVTLATASEDLVPDLPAAARTKATSWLAARGVEILTRARARPVDVDAASVLDAGVYEVDGERRRFDACLRCYGAAPATAWLRGFVELDDRGFVVVRAGKG